MFVFILWLRLVIHSTSIHQLFVIHSTSNHHLFPIHSPSFRHSFAELFDIQSFHWLVDIPWNVLNDKKGDEIMIECHHDHLPQHFEILLNSIIENSHSLRQWSFKYFSISWLKHRLHHLKHLAFISCSFNLHKYQMHNVYMTQCSPNSMKILATIK